MNKIRVSVSAGNFERIKDLQYSVIKLDPIIRVSVGDLIIVENDLISKELGNLSPLVREVIDIDVDEYIFEGSETYDVFIRNNNYLS